MDIIPTGTRVYFLSQQLYAACHLGIWCFNQQQELVYSTSDHEKEYQMFFLVGGCLDFALHQQDQPRVPMLLSDQMGLIWVAEFGIIDQQEVLLVLGPVYYSSSSIRNIEEDLRNTDFSLQLRSSLLAALSDVPIVSVSTLNQYAQMLHFAIYGEEIQGMSFLRQDDRLGRTNGPEEEEVVDAERTRATEQILLQCVREGNVHFREVMAQTTGAAGLTNRTLGSPLRSGKNTVIIFTALCSRAAIEGGLSATVAQKLENDYINRVETCHTITELTNLNMEMLNDFVQRVHRCSYMRHLSKPVQECCDYVRRNLNQPLPLSEIAGKIGYAEYYLTKKFKKEMGISLGEYIQRARIDRAKMLLTSTKMSIVEISEELQFGSRNYFSRVFSQQVGISPQEYRNAGNEEKEGQSHETEAEG